MFTLKQKFAIEDKKASPHHWCHCGRYRNPDLSVEYLREE